jgi:hypothetical protein
MKKMALVMVFVCLSGSALAADFGLGVSVRSGDATIYMPIDISEAFRIEPMLQYEYRKSEYTLFDDTIASTNTGTLWAVGVGLFGVTQLAESASVYYGGRVSYMSSESESSYLGTLPGGAVLAPESRESDGIVLAPTLGLEYHFSEHFSIGGEAALTYTNAENDDESSERISTTTNIIFRYMF